MTFRSLRSHILFTVIFIVSATIAGLIYFVQWQTNKSIEHLQEQTAQALLKAVVQTVENQYSNLRFYRQKTLELRKNELRDLLDVAYAGIQKIHEQEQCGLMTKEQAQQQATSMLRDMRYGPDKSGYFWIHEATYPFATMVMHPTIPQLDGKLLDTARFNTAFGKKINLFNAGTQICLKSGSGFVEYLWPKPTPEGLSSDQLKISYMRLFKPWNWIIGSGVYINDIEQEQSKRLEAVIKELRAIFLDSKLTRHSYIFLFDHKKNMLIHPFLEGKDSASIINPATERPMLDEIIDIAKSGQTYFDYNWTKKDGDPSLHRKRLYIKHFAPLNWYIGSAVYLDEQEEPIGNLNMKVLFLSAIFLLIAIFASLVLSKSMTTPLNKLAQVAETIQHKGFEAAEIPVSGSKEIQNLGLVLKRLLDTLKKNEINLKENAIKLKSAQKNLSRQLQFIKSLLSSLPTPVYFKDVEKDFLGFNKSFADFFGIPMIQIAETNIANLDPKNIGAHFLAMDKFIAENQDTSNLDYKITGADGAIHDIIISSKTFYDEDGNTDGTVVAFLDITERKKAQHALQNSEESVRITLSSIGDGVIATDVEGLVTRMNPAAEKLTGHSEKHALNSPFRDIFHATEPESVIEHIDNALKSGETTAHFSTSLRNDALETDFELSMNIAPIRNTNEAIVGAVIVFRDVTEELKMQEQLKHSQKMDAVGQLAGGVAHDFNNMLGGILGAAEIIQGKQENLDESQKKFLKMIIDSCERATDLVAKLLAFSRKGRIQSTAIDIHDSIERSIDLLLRILDKKISVEKHLDSSLHFVVGDPTQLQNAFINIGINAGHAMPEGGTLTFSTRLVQLDTTYCKVSRFKLEPGKYVEVAIRDTGTGIPPEYIDKIFDPFFTTKEQGKGTGLGLAAVYGIVQQHHGDLIVYSEMNMGTVFKICLPVSNYHAPSFSNQNSVIKGQGRILVVDDESFIRTTAEVILNDLGYDVVLAENGKQALELYEREHEQIDLVIIDMVMPLMNGRECFAKLQEITPDAKIIMASGFAENHDIGVLKAKGLTDFIHKPYRKVELSQIVARALGII